ncbi:hypothetical protein J1N35_014285 [Gossypium stocksii]|uniref:Aminotransferase-like plant mobile domain-containing protein n=1 Tax=Gossypium stocksii TaxID=47602 RepID=A0A9D3VWN7_9ROSI|nr:hypothetical protein J1N35_014285 [Gossypium stocksii]
MPYLDVIGFGTTALVQTFKLRANLISALVERRCLKTHTFHFLCGECTITLEDVAMQLGLLVGSDVVIGPSKVAKPSAIYYQLVGHSPGYGEARFSSLKFSWLIPIVGASGIGDVVSWYKCPGIGKSETLVVYCQMIEEYAGDKFVRMSYSAPDVVVVMSLWVHEYAIVWCINALVLKFSIVEWYSIDWVLRQFGCI